MFKPRDSRDNSSNKRFGDSSSGRGGHGGGGHRSGGEFGTASKFGGGGPPRGAFPGPKRDDLNLMSLQRPNFSKMDLKPFGKEFYQESSSVSTRTQHDVNGFYRDNNAVVNNVGSARILRPILQFNELSQSISRNIVDKLFACNYDKPTPIQSFCWPTLLSGQNMVGIAQTGSGKTLGFVLPMLVHISNNERYLRSFGREQTPGPMALILAPTRELAQQIQQVADSFGQVVGLRNIVIYGGASKGPQLGQIRRGAEIYIATPGRLLDFLKENTISLQKCTYLVLDEADRMLDMGFEPQIRKIIEQIRPDRQTAMFSATWPKEVRKLAEDFISNYTHISIGTQVLTANPNIRQIVEVMEEPEKETRLREVLGEIMNQRDSKAIIFAETKKRVDSISSFIKKLGFYCLTIHGDKKQMEREWVLNEFKQRPKCILCATDVAARGLNIEDIKYVINVDYPQATEDYVHRIGRTARNSNAGTSYTFLTRNNARHANELINVLRETNQEIGNDLMSLTGGRGGFGRPGMNRNGAGAYRGRNDYNSKPAYGHSNQTNGHANGNNSYANGVSNSGSAGARSYGPMPPAPMKRDYSHVDNGQVSSSASSSYDSRPSSDAKRQRSNRWDEPTSNSTNAAPAAYNGNSLMSAKIPPPAYPNYQNGHANGNGAAYGPSPPGSQTKSYENDLLASFRLAPPPPPPASTGVPPPSLAARPPVPLGAYQGYQAASAYYH